MFVIVFDPDNSCVQISDSVNHVSSLTPSIKFDSMAFMDIQHQPSMALSGLLMGHTYALLAIYSCKTTTMKTKMVVRREIALISQITLLRVKL